MDIEAKQNLGVISKCRGLEILVETHLLEELIFPFPRLEAFSRVQIVLKRGCFATRGNDFLQRISSVL